MSAIVEPAAPGAAPPADPPDWRPAGLAQHWREMRSRPAAWLARAHAGVHGEDGTVAALREALAAGPR